MGKHRRTSGMKDALSEMFGPPRRAHDHARLRAESEARHYRSA